MGDSSVDILSGPAGAINSSTAGIGSSTSSPTPTISISSETGISTPHSAGSDHGSVSLTAAVTSTIATPTAPEPFSTFTPMPTTASPSGSVTSGRSGLTSSAKVGLGIGIGLGIPLLIGVIGLCVFLSRKKKSRQGQGPYGPVMANEKGVERGSDSSHAAPHDLCPISSKAFTPSAAESADFVHAKTVSRQDGQQSVARNVPSQLPPITQQHWQDQGPYEEHNLAFGSRPYHDSAPVSAVESPPIFNTSLADRGTSATQDQGTGPHDWGHEQPPSPVSPVSDVSPVDTRPASLLLDETGRGAHHD